MQQERSGQRGSAGPAAAKPGRDGQLSQRKRCRSGHPQRGGPVVGVGAQRRQRRFEKLLAERVQKFIIQLRQAGVQVNADRQQPDQCPSAWRWGVSQDQSHEQRLIRPRLQAMLIHYDERRQRTGEQAQAALPNRVGRAAAGHHKSADGQEREQPV